MRIFALDTDDAFAATLSASLDEPLAHHEDRAFEDGEHKLRPLVDPRGDDVYVVTSLYGGPNRSPHDKLCRLLMFVSTLRDHGARRVTAVVPYLAYARKDRRTKPFDPLTLRYVAQWVEAAGTDQLIVLEAHNVAALENAFRRPMLHLSAHSLFDPEIAEIDREALVVASPDAGGVKRAQLWRESLEHRLGRPVGFAMIDKRRSAGVVSSERLVVGDVAGAIVLLLDDLIASGETMQRAAWRCRDAGAGEASTRLQSHGTFAPTGRTCSRPAFRAHRGQRQRATVRRTSAAPRPASKLRVVSTAPTVRRGDPRDARRRLDQRTRRRVLERVPLREREVVTRPLHPTRVCPGG